MVVGFQGQQHQFGAYMTSLTSSFAGLLAAHHPDALPWSRLGGGKLAETAPHGTTIVALRFSGGVLMAGDRQVTSGTTISYRYAQKVYSADEYSCVGVAGSASLAFEIARLFQLELLHYEKMEGRTLSLQGKANQLSSMIRRNLGMAMQGFVVVPIYAGYDLDSDVGRIFSYDPIGGVSEEHEGYQSIGSGSIFAMGSLKKLHRSTLDEREATVVAMEALYDAAEGDVATMGPDLAREVYPVAHVVTADGHRELPDDEIGPIAREVVQRRMGSPDGPKVTIEQERPS